MKNSDEHKTQVNKAKVNSLKIKSKFIKVPDTIRIPSAASDMIVVTKVKDLVKYIFQITQNSPKKFRFTFINRLQNLGLDCVENLYKANDIKLTNISKQDYLLRYKYQSMAMTNIKLLEYFALLSLENECILFKHYEQIAKQGATCLTLLSNWIQSDKNRVGGINC